MYQRRYSARPRARASYRRRPAVRAPRRRTYVRRATQKKQGLFAGLGREVVRNSVRGIAGMAGNALGTIAGGAAGAFLGGPAGAVVGAPIGRWLGSAAGRLVSTIAGFGDYDVKVNSLNPGALIPVEKVPEFQNLGSRCTIIRHKEFIQDIVTSATSGAFQIIPFRIQPGASNTFPWLSQVAQNYEQYRVLGMIFEYKTSSGSLSTTGQLGTVIMASQYNSLSPAFNSKQEMENYEFGCSTVASASLVHPIECDPSQTQCGGVFNIDTTNTIPATGDLRMYDLARFNIATAGMPNASETVGELWVSYEVCLMKPRLVPDTGSLSDHWQASVGLTGSNYMGTNFALTSESDGFTQISGSVAPTVSDTITFDRFFNGKVVMIYSVNGTTGITGLDMVVLGTHGATPLNLLNNNSIGSIIGEYTPASTVIHNAYFWNIQSVQGDPLPPTLTFNSGVFPEGPVFADLFLLQFSSDLN